MSISNPVIFSQATSNALVRSGNAILCLDGWAGGIC